MDSEFYLPFSSPFDVAEDEREEPVLLVPPGKTSQLEKAISAPLMALLAAWNRRANKGPIPLGGERADLDDRIRDEVWLLARHGYGIVESYGGGGGHRDVRVSAPTVVLPETFKYHVYSLQEMGIPQLMRSSRTFPATGGCQPGQLEQARVMADRVDGAVLMQRIRWDTGECFGERYCVHSPCVYVSEKISPAAAYDKFMEENEDGFVIDRFIALFEYMRRRECHRVEAMREMKQVNYQRLGEIAFYLAEVGAWRAYRDERVERGKAW